MAHGCKMCLVLVKTVLFIQLCNGESRYCKEAVDTVKNVESCPTSKTEWDTAAFNKDCSKIALQQNCSTVEKFVYHCVINGYRNKLLEVCAPSRLIFGNCVEFNEQGGVIQDQISAPCNETFPKCDNIYQSSTAYKYPDCYQLVSKEDIIHVSTTTTTKSTHSDGNNTS
uniref:Chitin-binding type-2 domain-containing protein n=1 Tax=Magallana gigas TaxID=29159 RepID=A0A8W8MIQ4_MAGGI